MERHVLKRYSDRCFKSKSTLWLSTNELFYPSLNVIHITSVILWPSNWHKKTDAANVKKLYYG